MSGLRLRVSHRDEYELQMKGKAVVSQQSTQKRAGTCGQVLPTRIPAPGGDAKVADPIQRIWKTVGQTLVTHWPRAGDRQPEEKAGHQAKCVQIGAQRGWTAREPLGRGTVGHVNLLVKLAAWIGTTEWERTRERIGSGWNWRRRLGGALFCLLVAATPGTCADAKNVSFKIPPVKIPLTVKDQSITITAWAQISMVSSNKDMQIFNLELDADLGELQQNLTGLLSAQLDKDDRCGERIQIQQATLVPAYPASIATVQLHFERWACIKAFGKQQPKKLVAGNAMIPLKLTPAVEQDNTELKLVPEVGTIQADGSLGELLRSGAVGEMIQEKIRSSILSALQKGTNLGATLPPAVQGYARIENAAFKDAGSGRLQVELDGQVRITKEQVQMLSEQVKERMGKK